MAHRYGSESLEHEVAELRKHQKQLVSALRLLFDLLEAYAPSWYTEEHHKKALAAPWRLAVVARPTNGRSPLESCPQALQLPRPAIPHR